VRIIRCDVCGKEVNATEVYARLTYKVAIKTVTKAGKETIRKVARSADFCSGDCYKMFNIEAEPVVASTQEPAQEVVRVVHPKLPFVCNECGKSFPSEVGLKIHKRMVHSVGRGTPVQ
jgi:hypothetical protein